MRGAMMCLLVACVVSVAAQFADLRGQFYFNDVNIPKSIPSDWNFEDPSIVRRIKLININVDKIEANAFENFTNLEELDLAGKINGIEDGAFRGLTRTERIILGANIQNIGLNVFSNLYNLNLLYLNGNKIKEIRLNNLAVLKRLDLSHNEITELNNNTFIDLVILFSIVMNNNKIRSIKSGTFSGCPNITNLILYNNQLIDIESDAFKDLHKLEVLTLRNNYLKTITSNHFKGLTSLKALDLSFNKITSLDPFLLNNLTELTDISFDNNLITSLPERFFNNTPKLKLINLGFNLLKEFHLYDNLVHLTGVILEHNQIESIKLSAQIQRNIIFINLEYNNLSHLDESFQHLINLQYLDLDNNKIKRFPLCIPGSLTELDLSHNELQGVALNKLCGSVSRGKLRIVDLSYNQFTSYNLTHTNNALLDVQPHLNEIDLSNNFLNADIVKFIQDFKLSQKYKLRIEPQRKLEVEVNDTESANNELNQNDDKTSKDIVQDKHNLKIIPLQKEDVKVNLSESMNIEVNPNDVERKHGNETTDNRNENQCTTWIAVTSAALAVAVFAVFSAILFVCKQRRRTNPNPNVNDAVMLNELYDDVGPATPVYHYPKFPLLYDGVGVQPTYLAVLPDPNPGPQPLEQEDIEPEENHYEEIG